MHTANSVPTSVHGYCKNKMPCCNPQYETEHIHIKYEITQAFLLRLTCTIEESNNPLLCDSSLESSCQCVIARNGNVTPRHGLCIAIRLHILSL